MDSLNKHSLKHLPSYQGWNHLKQPGINQSVAKEVDLNLKKVVENNLKTQDNCGSCGAVEYEFWCPTIRQDTCSDCCQFLLKTKRCKYPKCTYTYNIHK